MNILERGSRSSVTLFEIRLDSEVIILRGSPVEAAGAFFKGVLTFCLQDSLAVRGIRLKLIGVVRVGLHDVVSSSRSVKHEKIIYEKEWQFLNVEHSHKKGFVKLGPGNYEYPFEHVLPGNAPESVEGLDTAYIVYRMKATIERPRFSQDISTKKHVRIVRTLAPGDEALSSTMAVENVWPGKCQYSISVPAKACVFGTTIPLNIAIVPLLKGLLIGKVTCILREFDTFTIPERNAKKQNTRNVQTTNYDHGAFDDTEDGSERWVMHAMIDLPKSLGKCVQDCEVGNIKVRHKLRVSVQLHNPDGHTSELRASLPVQLFISPNHLMGEDNEIHSTVPAGLQLEDITAVPPRYDEHVYDRLWDDLPHDYSTPVPSGANTPAILSRTNSSENLVSFGAPRPASLSPPTLDLTGRLNGSRSNERPGTSSSSSATSSDRVSTEDLRVNLAVAEESIHDPLTAADTNGGNFAINRGGASETRSARSTRPNSPEHDNTTLLVSPQCPTPLAPLNINELSRVPSYRTAMKSTPQSTGGDIFSLPIYEDDGWNGQRSPPASPPLEPERSRPRSRGRRIGFTLRSGHHHSLSTGNTLEADRRLRSLHTRGR